VRTLGDFRLGANAGLPPALVLGYGQLSPTAIERGVALLAAAARDSFPSATDTG
jgi:hypothetical protein